MIMKLKLLLVLALICVISSLKLRQIPMPDDNNNDDFWDRPRPRPLPEPERRNISRPDDMNMTRRPDILNLTIITGGNMTNRTEDRNMTRAMDDRNMTRPSGFPDSSLSNLTSPLVGAHRPALPNVTSNFFQPPFIPTGFFTQEFRVIPPQFWLLSQNNPNAIMLNSNDNLNALSCGREGRVSLEPKSNSNLLVN
jgi:hypothetical protein